MAMNSQEAEGLANRLALLVSDDLGADAAGREVAELARRLGLSGAQLKAIFMAGLDPAGAVAARLIQQGERITELEAELEMAHDMLHRIEASARTLQRERDMLRSESQQLHKVLERRRVSRPVWIAAGVVALAWVVGGIWYLASGRARPAAVQQAQSAEAPQYRHGVVHENNVPLRSEPAIDAPSVAVLNEGTLVVVHRTLWHNLLQWVEIEIGGQTGYVLSTEVNLS
jgi:hypothetical protein